MEAFGATRIVCSFTLAVTAWAVSAGTPAAMADTTELRPVSDHVAGWTPVRADAAWAAIDDEVLAGQAVPQTDRIRARSGRRISVVDLESPALAEGDVATELTGHFFARTGKHTRLRIKLTTAGKVLSRDRLRQKSRAKWRRLPTVKVADDTDLSQLRIAFRASNRRKAEVRAAYGKVKTAVPAEEPPGQEPPTGEPPVDPPAEEPPVEEPPAEERPRAGLSVFGSTTTIRPDQPLPTGGSRAADLLGAQNEFESFQVAVEARDEPINGLTMEVAGALKGPGTSTIDTSDITIYREEFYEVSAAAGKPRSSRKGGEGLWPDALIPERDPYYGEDRAAFPVSIPSGKKEIAWIDVFIPAGAAAGLYQGELLVRDTGGTVGRIPIRTRVSSFRDALDLNPQERVLDDATRIFPVPRSSWQPSGAIPKPRRTGSSTTSTRAPRLRTE